MDIVVSMHLIFYPPNACLFAGPGTTVGHQLPVNLKVSCFIWGDLRDKTT